MKTISTKLNNQDFEKFQAMCNDDGVCASESLRDMIKRELETHDEYLEIEQNNSSESIEESKPIIKLVNDTEKPQVISHGRLLDDYGNVVGTF